MRCPWLRPPDTLAASMRAPGPLGTAVIALAIALASVPARAARSPRVPDPPTDGDDPLPPIDRRAATARDQVRREHGADEPLPPAGAITDARDAAAVDAAARVLLARGRRADAANDPGLAAEDWELAYQLLASLPERVAERNALGLDLARAHVRAHAVDGDATHLVRARDILEGTIARIRRADQPPTEHERGQIDDAMLLLEVVGSRLGTRPTAAPELRDRDVPRREPARLDAHGVDALLIGGGVGLGLSIIALATGGGLRDDSRVGGASNYGEYSRKIAARHQGSTAAFVVGGLLLAGGVATLATGLVMRRRIRATPSLASTGAGLVLEGRF